MSTLFVGLGHMGSPMATLHAAKFPTVVFDLSEAAVAAVTSGTTATSIADLQSVPADVDTVILMLPTSRHVETLVAGEGGLLSQLAPGSLIIDMGSSEPGSTRTLAGQSAAVGIDYVDAPVSGGVIKAQTGELAILVGGTETAVARAMPHLEVLGSAIVHVGASGAGDAVKALNNLVSASNMAIASEAVAVATNFGIAPKTMIEVLNAATGRSQATELKFPKYILTGEYNSGFAYDLMLKDMTIAMGMTTELETPVVDTVFERLSTGRASLGERPDHTEIGRLYGLGATADSTKEDNA